MMKIRYAKGGVKLVWESMGEETLMHNMFFENEENKPDFADSILVLDNENKHVGFLNDYWKDILLNTSFAVAHEISSHPLRLFKCGETGKWDIFHLPFNPVVWSFSWVDYLKAEQLQNLEVYLKDGVVVTPWGGDVFPISVFTENVMKLPFWKLAALTEKIAVHCARDKEHQNEELVKVMQEILKLRGLDEDETEIVFFDAEKPAAMLCDFYGLTFPEMKEKTSVVYFDKK